MKKLNMIQDLAIKRNNLLLYIKDNALKVVDFLEQENILLFGLDSFIIDGKEIQPYIEFSPEYSLYKSGKEVYNLCRRDILKAYDNNKHFVFELVYEGY